VKRLQFLTLAVLLFFISCKEKTTEPTPTKPVVTIISPQNNSSVAGSVTIEVKATDDKGIIRVEIYIDNTLDSDRVFTNTPYKYAWDVESLPDSSRHTIYARAFDTDGHVSSSSLVNTTTYNFRPTNLNITNATDTAITLTWQDNCSIETGFEIERAIDNGNFTQLAIISSNSTNHVVNALDKSFTYSFRVRAKTTYNVSGYTNTNKINYQFVGTLQRTLIGHTSSLNSVSYSPDGNYLASGSSDGTIKIWNVNDGSLIRTLTGHIGYVYSVSYSPDGNYLASGSIIDGTIKIWNVNDGSLIRTLTGHTNGVNSVSYSPNGNYIASGSYDKTIKIWNVNDGSLIRSLTGLDNSSVLAVSYSPDGSQIAGGYGYDKTIKVWNVNDGSLIRTLTGHVGWVNSVSYSPDGNNIASGSSDYTIKIWNVNNGSLIRTLMGHNDAVLSVSYNSDGSQIASGSYDGTLKIWNVNDGSLISSLTRHNDVVNSVSYSPNGNHLASGSRDKTIKIWERNSWVTIP